MEKNWSTLEKGDSIYLLVPYTEDGIIKYKANDNLNIYVKIKILSSNCQTGFQKTSKYL